MAPLLLIIGASGTIGTLLTHRLLAAGYRVRACGRDGERLRARLPAGAELRAADLRHDPLAPLLAGVDQVIYLLHSMDDGRNYPAYEVQAASRLAAALSSSTVRHLLFVGALSPEQPRSAHLRSRLASARILRASGVPLTELRAAIIIAPGSVPYELMRDLSLHLPLLLLPGASRQRSAPLAFDDLQAIIAQLLAQPALWGQLLELGGPEVLSYRQQLCQVAKGNGRQPQLLTLPLPLPLFRLLFGGLLPLLSSTPPRVVRALLAGMDQDLLPRQPLLATLPAPQLTLATAIARCASLQQLLPAASLAYPGNPLLRGDDATLGFYPLRLGARRRATVDALQLWQVASRIGGDNGYFCADWLWCLRGWLDRLAGGVGNVRQRPPQLAEGEQIDRWTIIRLTPGEELLLRFDMKAPGRGHLRISCRPLNDGAELQLSASWYPRGWPGLLYWWLLWPVHRLLFIAMARTICRCAIKEA